MPEVKADPYDIELENGKDFATDVLAVIQALPRQYEDGEPSRWWDIGDGWLLVDHLERKGGQYPRWEGTFLRVRNEDLPNRSGPRGITDLDLDDDEGLGEHIAFLYDEKTNLLWFQRDKRIVGKLLCMDYLRKMSGTSFAHSMRLREDAVRRARRLKVVRRVELGYLTDDMRNATGPLAKGLRLLMGYGAARIDVILTPSRGGSLDPEVKDLVADLGEEVEQDTGRVDKAKIKGRYEEDEERDEVIDLLRDRLAMSVRISRERRRDPIRLIGAVREIWSENRTKV